MLLGDKIDDAEKNKGLVRPFMCVSGEGGSKRVTGRCFKT